MPSKVFSASITGLDCHLIEVETDILHGLPAFHIVGLGDTAVQEAKERVTSAIKNSDLEFPRIKKVINLAPAHLKKHGPAFDLPIAVGLLTASNQIPEPQTKTLFVGELALNGSLRPIKGILTIAQFAYNNKFHQIFLPAENALEASTVLALSESSVIPAEAGICHPETPTKAEPSDFTGNSTEAPLQATSYKLPTSLKIMPVQNLAELTRHFLGHRKIRPFTSIPPCHPELVEGCHSRESTCHPEPVEACHSRLSFSRRSEAPLPASPYDLAYLKGQPHAKRALEIAAAGAHNLIFTGPPGTGKTHLARSLTTILPPLTPEESLIVTQIYSIVGLLPRHQPLIRKRPFRAIHHTASVHSIIGGGSIPKPGEISLAHRGVLFLDELAEFPSHILEALRQPLEDHRIVINRARQSLEFPAHFTLIAATNPCPCGYLTHPKKTCRCTASQIRQYQNKLSGPFLDRIDLKVEVNSVEFEKIHATAKEESSAAVQKRVQKARLLQAHRLRPAKLHVNSEMHLKHIQQFCPLDHPCQNLLKTANQKHEFSTRTVLKLIKIARTIADLENAENIQPAHLAEALQYRTSLQRQ